MPPSATLLDRLRDGCILPNQAVTGKRQVLQVLSDKVAELTGADSGDVLKSLLKREQLGSTAVGRGVAIPHCRLSELEHPFVGFLSSKNPIEFDALDREPVDLFFVLVANENNHQEHLMILGQLAQWCRQTHLMQSLRLASTREKVIETLEKA